MTAFAVATEDELSETVAEALLRQVGGHVVNHRLRRNGFGYLKHRFGTKVQTPGTASGDLAQVRRVLARGARLQRPMVPVRARPLGNRTSREVITVASPRS